MRTPPRRNLAEEFRRLPSLSDNFVVHHPNPLKDAFLLVGGRTRKFDSNGVHATHALPFRAKNPEEGRSLARIRDPAYG